MPKPVAIIESTLFMKETRSMGTMHFDKQYEYVCLCSHDHISYILEHSTTFLSSGSLASFFDIIIYSYDPFHLGSKSYQKRRRILGHDLHSSRAHAEETILAGVAPAKIYIYDPSDSKDFYETFWRIKHDYKTANPFVAINHNTLRGNSPAFTWKPLPFPNICFKTFAQKQELAPLVILSSTPSPKAHSLPSSPQRTVINLPPSSASAPVTPQGRYATVGNPTVQAGYQVVTKKSNAARKLFPPGLMESSFMGHNGVEKGTEYQRDSDELTPLHHPTKHRHSFRCCFGCCCSD